MSAAPESQVQKGLRISAQRLQDASTKLLDAVGQADLTKREQLKYIQRLQEKLNLLQRDFYREMEELDVHLRSLENTKDDKYYRGVAASRLTIPSNETYALGEELFLKTPSASGGAGGGASAAAGPANALGLNESVVTGLSKKRTRHNRRKSSRKNSRSRRPKN